VLLDQAGLLRDVRGRGAAAGQEPAPASTHSGGGRRSSAGAPESTEAAIRADARLSAAQKRALLAVYRSYISQPSDDD
jgi:hypothetical protein